MQNFFSSNNSLIIITSDEPWGDVWHTQLHYAYQLSKRCMVIYLAPPDKWKFSNLFRWGRSSEKINTQLMVFKYHNVFPITFLNSFFSLLNDVINSFLIKKVISHQTATIFLWRFDHFRFLVHPSIKVLRTIYHVVDQYLGTSNDNRLALQSDMVICTSPKFVDYYSKLNNYVINVPQAISTEEFICDEALVKKIKTDYKKIILFIGTISTDISLEILKGVSAQHSNYTLLIIGPDKLFDEQDKKNFKDLLTNHNVKYVGTIPGPELKNYVKASEVCLIPYKFGYEKKMSVRSPLKVISYIAQKKIVITSIDCEISQLENKVIFKAENAEAFINLTKNAIEKKIVADEDAVNDFLKKINYDSLLDFIFSELKKCDYE